MVQREIYRLVTREQAEAAAAQLMDINSKILVNRILLFFGVPKEALSNGSAPTHMLIASQRPCAVGRLCPGKTRGCFRSYQVSALPMLQWEERLRKWGGRAQQSTCHLFIPLRINNSSLRIMRLNSNAFLCSCHEAKPRWRSPDKYQRAWETWKRKQRRKGVFQEQVRMAYLSSCNSTRHWLQLASSQGSLHSTVSQSFHYKSHFKVRQFIASSLYDLCSKEKQNLIALLFLILFLLTLWLPSPAEHILIIIQGRQTPLGRYLSTFMQDKYVLSMP